jgi:CheY-like chemotaxis protein
MIRADPDRMQQVVRNVLDNALKFTPVGGKVTVRTSEQDTVARNGNGGPAVSLMIVDTGIGMSAGEIARVFDPFEQGDPSTTRRFSGLGIGLTISRRLAELHNGTLEAHSAGANQGSTFTLRLPLLTESSAQAAQGQAPPFTAGSAAAITQSPRPGALRILIVEDNAETVRALDRLLRSHGHQTAIAGSAQQAVSIIDTRPIDLLISDIGLPDVSGWELMRSLREAGHPIRGIALSGFVTEEDRQRSLDAGYVEHLGKPIELNRLIGAIDAATAATDRK